MGVSKVLKIRYLRWIPASQFVQQTSSLVEKNGFLKTSCENGQQTKSHLDQFNQFYTDVNHGDIFTLEYMHEKETSSLYFNNKHLGSIRSKAFSEALFSVWFGK